MNGIHGDDTEQAYLNSAVCSAAIDQPDGPKIVTRRRSSNLLKTNCNGSAKFLEQSFPNLSRSNHLIYCTRPRISVYLCSGVEERAPTHPLGLNQSVKLQHGQKEAAKNVENLSVAANNIENLIDQSSSSSSLASSSASTTLLLSPAPNYHSNHIKNAFKELSNNNSNRSEKNAGKKRQTTKPATRMAVKEEAKSAEEAPREMLCPVQGCNSEGSVDGAHYSYDKCPVYFGMSDEECKKRRVELDKRLKELKETLVRINDGKKMLRNKVCLKLE